MNDQQFSALVVDDEPALRRLTAAALKRFNFTCDEASDGDEAGSLIGRRKYDVVISDLRMPKRNGHALAIELLSGGSERPLVVILTGVLDPRLAQDLIARGVDEIEFKPVNYALFGAKIRARCERRTSRPSAAGEPTEVLPRSQSGAEHVRDPGERVTRQQLEERLAKMADSIPVSAAAVEVANLVSDETSNAGAIARCIARDPGLSVELLKVANSSYYNPTGQLSDDLHSAILRLGHRRISELAVTSASLHILSKSQLRWIDAEAVWQRCVMAGKAIEHLRATATVGGDDEGLFLSATLLPMSRVFSGLAFPDLYRRLVERCGQTGQSLASLERDALEVPPEQALGMYLEQAGLSPRLYKTLKHGTTPPDKLESFTEPLRTRVACLQVAAALSSAVVGRWLPWDEMSFPPASIVRRLDADRLAAIIDRLRVELVRLTTDQASKAPTIISPQFAGGLEAKEIRYYKLSVEPFDLLLAVLESLGLKVVPVARREACDQEPVLVNCLDVSEERLDQFLQECQPNVSRVLIGHDANHPARSPRGALIGMPCSFQRFVEQVRTTARSNFPIGKSS